MGDGRAGTRNGAAPNRPEVTIRGSTRPGVPARAGRYTSGGVDPSISGQPGADPIGAPALATVPPPESVRTHALPFDPTYIDGLALDTLYDSAGPPGAPAQFVDGDPPPGGHDTADPESC